MRTHRGLLARGGGEHHLGGARHRRTTEERETDDVGGGARDWSDERASSKSEKERKKHLVSMRSDERVVIKCIDIKMFTYSIKRLELRRDFSGQLTGVDVVQHVLSRPQIAGHDIVQTRI